MKGKLIKKDNQYYCLDVNTIIIGTTDEALLIHKSLSTKKLSKQNCDEIFGIVDIDTMMCNIESNCSKTKEGFVLGFKMVMELNKDKLFTEQDMKKAISFGQGMELWKEEEQVDSFIKSIQQPTEIEVEIETEPKYIRMGGVKGVKGSSTKISNPAYGCNKTDKNGCLILKKIENG